MDRHVLAHCRIVHTISLLTPPGTPLSRIYSTTYIVLMSSIPSATITFYECCTRPYLFFSKMVMTDTVTQDTREYRMDPTGRQQACTV